MTTNTMTYRGYTARVEVDARDDIFVGRVLGISDVINFHATTVESLKKEFRLSIDDYLAWCAEEGRSPKKPASGKLTLRVPPEIHEKAAIAAQSRGKSLNQWATELLEKAVSA
jgi:predicted HicB family RNase H-like nuclease